MALVETGHEARFLLEISGISSETLIVDFTAHERTSSPFECSVSLACEEEIAFDDAVGKEAVLTLLGNDEDRYLHGIVNKFQHAGSQGRFHLYQARIVPALWLLSLEQDCRIFQNKAVQEIVTLILKDGGITADRYDFRLQGRYLPREYCVQYRETDLNFISRLLEEEGIYYFFEHSKQKHVLVFADSNSAYKPIPGKADLPINPAGGMTPEEECIFGFAFSRRILSGKMTQSDFHFEKPSLDLTTQEQASSHQKLEVYDYPGKYVDKNRGKKLTQVRLQELSVFTDKAEGQSVCPRFTPGFTFELTEHDRQTFNQEYLLIDVFHTGSQPQSLQEEGGSGQGGSYSNDFLGIPSSVTLKPERISPKPIVEGVQTAIVVGPKGEEIYTDKYGRVKVQFHWDRQGARDENSSCWIRVASIFAGGNYGSIFTPRVGQEVVVGFLEGDPDKPIITGRVYNADNMPPYTLPDEKTKSTVKTNSSIGGDGFNEIRFEDKKGSEEIYLHGQKNWTIAIRNNKSQNVGHNETLTVGNDRNKTVKKNQSETIGENKTIAVGKDHSETIGGSANINVGESESISVGKNMDEVVGEDKSITVGGNLTENIGKDTTVTAGKNFRLEIGENGDILIGKKTKVQSGDDLAISGGTKGVVTVENQLTIRCGDASITMKKDGSIQFRGKDIKINGSGEISLKASKYIVLKGSKIMSN